MSKPDPRAAFLRAIQKLRKNNSYASVAAQLGISAQSLHYAIVTEWTWCPKKAAKPLAKLSGIPLEHIRPDLA